jgi:hypothetical protein
MRRQGMRSGTRSRPVICGVAPQHSALGTDKGLRYKIDFKSYNDALTILEYLQNNL